MEKVVCFESLFLFQLYSPSETSPCFFKKQTNKQTKTLKPLTPMRFAHVF